MHNQVVDNDLVIGRAEECGKLLIQALDWVPAFEVVEITEIYVLLRREVGLPKCEGTNRGACDVADKKDVVGPRGTGEPIDGGPDLSNDPKDLSWQRARNCSFLNSSRRSLGGRVMRAVWLIRLK